MKFDGDTVALDVLLLVGITVTFVILSSPVSSTTVKLSLSPASEVVRVGLEIVISAESLSLLITVTSFGSSEL